MDKLKSYLGFTPTKNDGRYNHRLRRHLESIAFNIYFNSYKRKTSIPEEFVETIQNTQSKSIALQKLQLKILKTLRRTWIEVSKEANDKPAG
jgi:NADPH-dependent 7-cyano-7-deazaguanine reductase QueF